MNDVISSLKKEYSGKKVLVVGLGLQGGGSGVAKFFAELGAQVTVTDKKTKKELYRSIDRLKHLPITFHLGSHNLKDFLEAYVIFKGPSVSWTLEGIVEAEKKGIPVEMELSFFAKHSPAKIIGITGTRGKSTTTQIIYTLLKSSNYPVYLGGGLPDISTISYLKKLTADDWVVMELSSWALSGFHRKKIGPHIAVFTNFYPDHLNYYKDMNDYLYDKSAIYLYQKRSNYLVINKRLKNVIPCLTRNPENYIDSRFRGNDSCVLFFDEDDFPYKLRYLKGGHNVENAAAALNVAKILGIDEKKAIDIISNFKGLLFRQEVVGEKDQVIFINDTTSTTPVATMKAFDSFAHSGKKVYLILGGASKNLPYDVLINQLIDAEKIILLKGSFTDEILPILKEKYKDRITEVYSDLEKAIMVAYQFAKKTGGYVLFSPAAPSFAMFNNEFHRGEEFNRIVKEITNHK